MPAHIIWGADDRIIPAPHAHQSLTLIEPRVVPHTGHLVHLEQADELNRLIRHFAARADASAQEMAQ